VTKLDECQVLHLPKIADTLTFVEGGHHIPFDIRLVYYLYDVPSGAERGGYSRKALHELIIACREVFMWYSTIDERSCYWLRMDMASTSFH
jgi:hypothetical protein